MAMKAKVISGIKELRSHAGAWDELWMASDVSDPTATAELLAMWLEQFAAGQRFHAIVVERDGQFLAALPLAARRVRKVLLTGHVPCNGWAQGGGLLVRRDVDSKAAVDMLVQQLRKLPWGLLWFECVRIDTTGYMAFQEAAKEAEVLFTMTPQYCVGYIDTSGDWQEYCTGLSANTRKNLNKWRRKFENEPGARIVDGPWESPAELEHLLRRAFELEHTTWKGRNGSSVIARGLLAWFLRQAKALHNAGFLELSLAYIGERPIAFQYGYTCKGVYHDCKTSFDAEFKNMAPGQFLYQHITQQCFENPTILRRDNLGAVSEASRIWHTGTYRIGQLLFAPRGSWERIVLMARRRWPSATTTSSSTE